MARCYSACVRHRYPPGLPDVWLISDARNDDRLEVAIDRLPPRSGMVFRHYHLPSPERRRRFLKLAARLRLRGHLMALAGTVAEARRWGADGAYGSPERLAKGPALLRLATVHSLRELARANRSRADAVLLSPVFATKTHPGARCLGATRFLLLAARSRVPVIALGGMNPTRAQRLGTRRWAAIESLAQPRTRTFPIHS